MAGEDNNTYYNQLFTEDLRDHDNRIKKLEESVSGLDKKIAVSDTILGRVEVAFNRNIDVLSKTTDAINCIEKTMISMQNQINTSAEITVRIKNKVDQIESGFLASEEKAKLDFREVVKEIFKSKLVWIIGGGFFISLLQLIIEFVKNFDSFNNLIK
jgi:hypothetical protein